MLPLFTHDPLIGCTQLGKDGNGKKIAKLLKCQGDEIDTSSEYRERATTILGSFYLDKKEQSYGYTWDNVQLETLVDICVLMNIKDFTPTEIESLIGIYVSLKIHLMKI
jgi:hypothetical protein